MEYQYQYQILIIFDIQKNRSKYPGKLWTKSQILVSILMAFLRVTNDSKMNCSDLLQPLWYKISYEVTVTITLCLSAISGQVRLTNTGCPNNMHNIILGGPSTFPCWLESVIFYFYCGTTKLFDNATN